MEKSEALHQLDKIIKANSQELKTGQFDEERYTAIENIKELKEDLISLINKIYS